MTAIVGAAVLVAVRGGSSPADPTPVDRCRPAEPARSLSVQPWADVGALSEGAVRIINDNGGWSWFQDERAVFTDDGRLLVTSVADREGSDGVARDGATEVTSVDLRSGAAWTDIVHKGLASDDHNVAALLELPDRILAFATGHSSDPNIYRSRLEPGAVSWIEDAPIDRPEARRFDPALERTSGVTYSNLAHLAAENGGRGRTYDVFRSAGEKLHLITSDDGGSSWDDRGRIFDGFRAYIRMVSDGQRRIWFTITDGHPDNFDGTSLYAGYIEDGAIHRSDGTVVAPLGRPVDPAALTPIYEGQPGTAAEQIDAWGADIALDPDGQPVVTFSTTVPGDPQRESRYKDHEALYARWDGGAWRVNGLADAGTEVGDQLHYTGLTAIDPGDTSRVILSTDVDPESGRPLTSSADGKVHHELFEGRTTDDGATWTWVAVTRDSTADNLRPVIPTPRDGHDALVWMRGTYRTPLRFDTDIVALVDPGRPPGPVDPSAARPGRLTGVAEGAVPMAADLDGDDDDDLTLFGPGSEPDVQVSFLPEGHRRSVARRQDAPASTRPVTGDFDGNGRADFVWYVPGGESSLWWGSSTGNPEHQPLSVQGNYHPVAGDLDGDGCDDILWHGPGARSDVLWRGRPGRTFAIEAASVAGPAGLQAGDLDGDGRDDLVGHEPGAGDRRVWWSGAGGPAGPGTALTAGRSDESRLPATSVPAVGDLDGDGRDEILWTTPGETAAALWAVGRDTSVQARPCELPGTGTTVLGDLDGDGRDEIASTSASSSTLAVAWATDDPGAARAPCADR